MFAYPPSTRFDKTVPKKRSATPLWINLAGHEVPFAPHLEALRPEEASAARVLRELVKNEQLG